MLRENKSKGFTLVELLVSISVVSILNLVAFPQFQSFVNHFRSCTPGVLTLTSHTDLEEIVRQPLVEGKIWRGFPAHMQPLLVVETPQGKKYFDKIEVKPGSNRWTAENGQVFIGLEGQRNLSQEFKLIIVVVTKEEATKILGSESMRNDVDDLYGCRVSTTVVVRK